LVFGFCISFWFWFSGVGGVDEYMPKMCRFNPRVRCYHSSCSSLDSMGNVVVCSLVPNPDGCCLPRRVGLQLRGVFDKHVLRRGS
jgi:hypothetical protein